MPLTTTLTPFYLMGLPLRTSPKQAQAEIGAQWERFFHEKWLETIPNRLNDILYGLYINYEGDYQDPYTLIIGAQVSSIRSVPEGLMAYEIPAQTYAQFQVEGELPQALIAKWIEIWDTPLERTYSADFERYDGGDISIFIGIR